MCEMFGVSSDRTIDVTAELKTFFRHGEYNPHGWGIASWNDAGKITIDKEPVDSTRSAKIVKLLSSGISCRGIIAHIRKATIGYVEHKNTHPFIAHDPNWREWAFAHNGTIFECDDLSIYSYKQKGSTDSERVFLYLLDKINEETDKKGHELDAKERFDVVDRIVTGLSPKNKLNIILYDGEQTYLHTNYKDSLYVSQTEDGALFSTKPLSVGTWDHLPFKTLVSYKEGEPFLFGKEHEGEYIPDEQAIRAIFLANAGL